MRQFTRVSVAARQWLGDSEQAMPDKEFDPAP